MIYWLCACIREQSPSLQAVHFCGNPGLTPALKTKVRQLFEAPETELETFTPPTCKLTELREEQRQRRDAEAQLNKGIKEAVELERPWPGREGELSRHERKLII